MELHRFDSTDPDIDQTNFTTEDWSETTYGPRKEDDTFNVPVPRGVSFTIRVCVDFSNASDSASRYSRIGFIVLVNLINSAPIPRNMGFVNHRVFALSSLQ